MRVWIHIGTHKTGSTSIQAFLRAHSSSLRAAGILVPQAGTLHGESGHHGIAWGLCGDPRFRPERGTLDDLLAELSASDARSAVLSSEDFEYLADVPTALSRLESSLIAAGHGPGYILFSRRPDAYARSLHSELRKHGVEVPFDEFVEEVLETGKFVARGTWAFYFDLKAFEHAWRRGARAPLTIVDYDAAAADPGVLPAFLRLIGAPEALVEAGRGAPHDARPSSLPRPRRVPRPTPLFRHGR